jgi:hypothetical protein
MVIGNNQVIAKFVYSSEGSLTRVLDQLSSSDAPTRLGIVKFVLDLSHASGLLAPLRQAFLGQLLAHGLLDHLAHTLALRLLDLDPDPDIGERSEEEGSKLGRCTEVGPEVEETKGVLQTLPHIDATIASEGSRVSSLSSGCSEGCCSVFQLEQLQVWSIELLAEVLHTCPGTKQVDHQH